MSSASSANGGSSAAPVHRTLAADLRRRRARALALEAGHERVARRAGPKRGAVNRQTSSFGKLFARPARSTGSPRVTRGEGVVMPFKDPASVRRNVYTLARSRAERDAGNGIQLDRITDGGPLRATIVGQEDTVAAREIELARVADQEL